MVWGNKMQEGRRQVVHSRVLSLEDGVRVEGCMSLCWRVMHLVVLWGVNVD